MTAQPPSSAEYAVDTRHQRRLLPIVDRHFQWKYTLIVALVGVGCTAVMSVFLYNAHMANTRLLDLTGDARLQEQVAQGDRQFLVVLVLGAALLALVLGIWGLVVTHRIAGPVYLAARYLGAIAKGQYPDVRPLRKHDELQGFFRILIEAVQALRQRDRMALTEHDRALSSVKHALESQDAVTQRQTLQDCVQILERQRQQLAATLGEGEGIHVEKHDREI